MRQDAIIYNLLYSISKVFRQNLINPVLFKYHNTFFPNFERDSNVEIWTKTFLKETLRFILQLVWNHPFASHMSTTNQFFTYHHKQVLNQIFCFEVACLENCFILNLDGNSLLSTLTIQVFYFINAIIINCVMKPSL